VTWPSWRPRRLARIGPGLPMQARLTLEMNGERLTVLRLSSTVFELLRDNGEAVHVVLVAQCECRAKDCPHVEALRRYGIIP
jgi:hypothetical protein